MTGPSAMAPDEIRPTVTARLWDRACRKRSEVVAAGTRDIPGVRILERVVHVDLMKTARDVCGPLDGPEH